MNNVHFSSKNHDWQTPDVILDRVRQVNPIGLDPCTTDANPTGAKTFYTIKDNGLVQDWSNKGLVYVNSPYGREIKKWVDKVIYEYNFNKSSEIIMLTPSRTDTAWFQKLMRQYPPGVCLVSGRLVFKGAPHPAPFPSSIFYFGPNYNAFDEAFRDIGIII